MAHPVGAGARRASSRLWAGERSVRPVPASSTFRPHALMRSCWAQSFQEYFVCVCVLLMNIYFNESQLNIQTAGTKSSEKLM